MVAPDGEYAVHIGRSMIERMPTDLVMRTRCAIITNSRVGVLHVQRLGASLQAMGTRAYVIEIPEGERFKTLTTVSTIFDRLIDAQFDRESTIIALGGGVVGDVAGFAAATFMRGVNLIHVPTTLLAMVDASIGGKVAVDHPRGKNLIGAFKTPRAVIVDPSVLDTLPEEEWRSGMAEVVKHAIIGGEDLFGLLERADLKSATNWLEPAIRVKTDIVTRDPLERGERAVLNLGHTFGHAFEQVEHYAMKHGFAVSMGLACAMRLSESRGLLRPETAERVHALLARIGLPTEIPERLGDYAILHAMQTDKKRSNDRLRFILPSALGDVVIAEDVTEQEIRDALCAARPSHAFQVCSLA